MSMTVMGTPPDGTASQDDGCEDVRLSELGRSRQQPIAAGKLGRPRAKSKQHLAVEVIDLLAQQRAQVFVAGNRATIA